MYRKISLLLLILSIIAGCMKIKQVNYGRVILKMGSVYKIAENSKIMKKDSGVGVSGKTEEESKKKELKIGDLVYKNDRIVTSENSLCNIQIGNNVIKIKENTEVSISEIMWDNAQTREYSKLSLIIGKIFVKARKTAKDYKFEVYTPTAVIGVRGTKFMVENNPDQTRVYIREGRVTVKLRRMSVEGLGLNEIEPLSSAEKRLEEVAPQVQITNNEMIVIRKKAVDRILKEIKPKIIRPKLTVSEKTIIKNRLKEVFIKIKGTPKEIQMDEFKGLNSVKDGLIKTMTGIINITSYPDNSEVFIDNIFIGKTPISKVIEAEKLYTIKIILPGYNEKILKVKLRKEEEKILNLILEPKEKGLVPKVLKKDVRVKGEPIFINGILCYAEEDGNISAYKRGSLLWKYNTGNIINTSPLFYKGKVIIGGNDEILRGIDIRDGRVLWKHKIGTLIFSKPVISDNKLFVGTANGIIYAIEPSTGKIIWQYKTGSGIFVTPAVDQNNLYFCTEDNNLFALNKDTGKLLWKKDTGAKIVASSPVIYDNKIYFGNYRGAVVCLEKRRGRIIWKRYLNGRILATIAIYKSGDERQKTDAAFLVVGTVAGHFYKIRASNGKIIWHKKFGAGIMTKAVIKKSKARGLLDSNDVVYVGLNNGVIYKLLLGTGEILDKKRLAGGINALFSSKDGILVSTDRGIYFIE